MSLTKTPLSMLEARGDANSDVRFSGTQVETQTDEDINNTGLAPNGHSYDDATGALTLKLINGETVVVQGFITQGNIGLGERGDQGIGGQDGIVGLNGQDGNQGASGCEGPPGTPGATGSAGGIGPQGEDGAQGLQGPIGNVGEDGVPLTYVQSEDPGAVGAGAFWIRP